MIDLNPPCCPGMSGEPVPVVARHCLMRFRRIALVRDKLASMVSLISACKSPGAKLRGGIRTVNYLLLFVVSRLREPRGRSTFFSLFWTRQSRRERRRSTARWNRIVPGIRSRQHRATSRSNGLRHSIAKTRAPRVVRRSGGVSGFCAGSLAAPI